MEKLSKLLGHSSVMVTERHYCHLRLDLFRDSDYDLFDVDLQAKGEVITLPPAATDSGAVSYAAVTINRGEGEQAPQGIEIKSKLG